MAASEWFLLGAPWDCSGTDRGEAGAPDALRAADLRERIGVDLGDAATLISDRRRDEETGVLALADTIAAAHALADSLDAGMREHTGRRPLIAGGDCSLLLGVFTHLRRAFGAVGLWMVDGHPDCRDPHASETGETADLDLALLTGRGPAALTALAGAAPMVEPRHVALIGHRTAGLDAAAAAELDRVPAAALTIDAPAVTADPREAGHTAATWAYRAGVPMWLHVDVDVLDPSAMPAVTYPQPGGPDFDQLAAVLTPLAAAPGLLGISIADFRPDLDPDGRLAAKLIALLDPLL